MTILVTGGAGFIGSNFIRYFLKHHPQVKIINLDKLTYAASQQTTKDLEGSPNYKFVKGDIGDKNLVEKVMDGVDMVVNFAAESHVDRSILDPYIFVKTNVLGTQVLLETALKAKVKRFHHISTDEVWGSLELDSKEKFTEATPYRPRSPYAASKAAADHLVRAYYETYGLAITISNCSNNFGPYQFPEKVLPLFITNALEDKPLPLYGDGLYVRDWIYVEDHCLGIDLVLEKGKVGETYLVGAENEISNLDLAKRVLAYLGKSDKLIKHVPDRPGHDRRYGIDPTKIRRKLGFKPRYSFEGALKKTIDWYKQNDRWWKPLKKEVARQGVWTKN